MKTFTAIVLIGVVTPDDVTAEQVVLAVQDAVHYSLLPGVIPFAMRFITPIDFEVSAGLTSGDDETQEREQFEGELYQL